MLKRGSRIFSLAAIVIAMLSTADAGMKRESDANFIARLVGYKSWKQVNRFDFDVSAASFKIESSMPLGGG